MRTDFQGLQTWLRSCVECGHSFETRDITEHFCPFCRAKKKPRPKREPAPR